MTRSKLRCMDCTAKFDSDDDAQTHEDNTGHTVSLNEPPEDATERDRRAMGFEPRPEPTEGHTQVIDGKRVGRRRADY